MNAQIDVEQDLVNPKIKNNSSNITNLFEILYTKENCKVVNKKIKHKCKILKFTTEWNFNEIFENLSKLESAYFPYLFILIIETESFGFSKPKSNPIHEKLKMLEHFVKTFTKDRSILFKLTAINENITKFYYKDDDVDELILINQDQVGENFYDFPTFFCCLMGGTFKAFDNITIHKIIKLKNSHLALKLLKLWTQGSNSNSEELTIKLIFKCASKGSKKAFLAALDAPLKAQEVIHNLDAQYFLTELFESDDASHKKSDCSNQKNESSRKSVLQCAVENSNSDVIDFLIENCTHLIQQLPLEHQVYISTSAYTTKQFKVLADLLEFCDFPFPNKYDSNSIPDERLRRITFDRNKFHSDIMAGNFSKLRKFIEKYPNLKIARNSKNISAAYKALKSKKYENFFRLKSIGFQATEFGNYEETITNSKELKRAKTIAAIITQENIKESIETVNKTVMLLCTRSFIHNKKITKEIEKDYRKKIEEWYSCIYKTEFGPMLLNAVVQSEKLKIIYDFNSESVSYYF